MTIFLDNAVDREMGVDRTHFVQKALLGSLSHCSATRNK